MIRITKAKETRQRDVKRERVVLMIGQRSWHLSKVEAKKLAVALKEATR